MVFELLDFLFKLICCGFAAMIVAKYIMKLSLYFIEKASLTILDTYFTRLLAFQMFLDQQKQGVGKIAEKRGTQENKQEH